MSGPTYQFQRGEYARIAVSYEGSEAPYDDLTGATVAVTATHVDGGTVLTGTGALDPAGGDGKVHGFYGSFTGAQTSGAPAGRYRVDLTVTDSGAGYPQIERCYMVLE